MREGITVLIYGVCNGKKEQLLEKSRDQALRYELYKWEQSSEYCL